MADSIDVIINFKEGSLGGLEDAISQIKGLETEVDSAIKSFSPFKTLFQEVGNNLKDAFSTTHILEFGKQGMDALTKIGQGGNQLQILKDVGDLFNKSADAAGKASGILADFAKSGASSQTSLSGLLGQGLGPVAEKMGNLLTGVTNNKTGFKDFITVIENGASKFSSLKGLTTDLSNAENAHTGIKTVGTIAAQAWGLVIGENNIAQELATGLQLGLTAAQEAATVAQWALNVAMDANPIGLIVTGIALLAGGLYLAYQKSETFRAVLSGIGEVGSDLVLIFKGLGEVIIGAFKFDLSMVNQGFSDVKKGAGDIGSAFKRGYDESIAKSYKDEADRKAKEEEDAKNGKGVGSQVTKNNLSTTKNGGLSTQITNKGNKKGKGLDKATVKNTSVTTPKGQRKGKTQAKANKPGKGMASQIKKDHPVIKPATKSNKNTQSNSTNLSHDHQTNNGSPLAVPKSQTTGNTATPISKSQGGAASNSAQLSGGNAVRNVTVTIGKLIEKLEFHTTNLQGSNTTDIKRQLTELLVSVVHDSELALGSR